jgi:hypothetical protein
MRKYSFEVFTFTTFRVLHLTSVHLGNFDFLEVLIADPSDRAV